MADDLMAFLEGRRAGGFTPRLTYSPDGDFLTYFFRNDEAFAECVDARLTVYRAIDGGDLVGFKLKRVRRLLLSLLRSSSAGSGSP